MNKTTSFHRLIILASILSLCCLPACKLQFTLQSNPATSPTPTTPLLTASELEPLLFQKGDLYPEYKPGAVSKEAPESMIIVEPDLILGIPFLITGRWSGEVLVFIYQDLHNVEIVYPHYVSMLENYTAPDLVETKTYSISGIGEDAYFAGIKTTEMIFTRLVFTRCSAVVNITLLHSIMGDQDISAYARNLDQRIQDLVCRNFVIKSETTWRNPPIQD